MASKNNQKLRNIPAVSAILEREDIKALCLEWSFTYVAYVAKVIIAESRREAEKSVSVKNAEQISALIKKAFEKKYSDLIKPVINATGVALHTNLGRAPLSEEVLKAVSDCSAGYCNLEFDLMTGKRSKRGELAGEMAAVLGGAEAGVIVNNCAAAVLLIVSCFASEKEVVVSRGELIQIGGGFRIPEIITSSGARLKEIGTTNRTVLNDYAKGINKNTGLILKVHRSNFEIQGFTEEAGISELAVLAHKRRIPMLYDLGSGLYDDFGIEEFGAEPDIIAAVRSKADLVCFSGDKLLGGPQAGIIIGKKKFIEKLRKHPFYRPLRPDKMCLTAIEHTLLCHLTDPAKVRLHQIFGEGIDRLKDRANHICARVGLDFVVPMGMKATAGGGSTPAVNYNSYGLEIDSNPTKLDEKLRSHSPSIVARSFKGKILLDLTTVLPSQDNILIEALKACLS
jgi:L-seryl-tRNA(Ser) seleniumtransferase